MLWSKPIALGVLMPATAAHRIDLMGCPLDALDMGSTLDRVEALIADGGPHQHMCVNANKVVMMHHDLRLRRIVRESALINADGVGIMIAAKVLGASVPERVTGVDLFGELVRVCPERGWRPFLLGARPQVIERTAEVLRERTPGLDIAGVHHGYFGAEDEQDVVRQIRESGADLLFVGLPSPRKEIFLDTWLHELGVPFCMGVGGTFDVVSGHVQRAPDWARANGLEWAFRLAQEPRKMWRRNVFGSTQFLARLAGARAGLYRVPT